MAEMSKSSRASPRSNIAARFKNASQDTLPPIGVFWDIENCQVPKGKSVTALIQAIRERFFYGHREAEFLCVCDINKENKDVIQELNLAQVTVVHINATSKNAADDKLKQCMRRFVDTHGMPATILLISGDVNFATHLSDFHHRDSIHIILLHTSHTPEPLLVCAHEHYNFNELTMNLPNRSSMKGSSNRCELIVKDLPTNRDAKQIQSRLRQLSDNCGGKVLGVSGSTAKLRFSSFEAAQRAKKRMDREDVFGKKITVSYFQPSTSGDECPDAAQRTTAYQSNQKSYKNRRQCVSSSSSCNSSPVSQSGMDNDSGEGRRSQNDDIPIVKQRFNFPPPPNIEESHCKQEDSENCIEIFDNSKMYDKIKALSIEEIQDLKNSKWSICHDQRKKDGSPVNQMSKLVDHGNKSVLAPKNVGRVSPFLMMDGTSKPGYQFSSITRPDSTPYNQRNVSADNYNGTSFHYGNLNSGSPILFSSLSPSLEHQNQFCWNSQTASLMSDSIHPIGRASPIIPSIPPSPVELLVTNLDQSFEVNEMKKILLSVFREHVMVLHISMLLQPDGNLKAVVKVPSLQDAQYAISQLHRRKIGYKRLLISYVSTDRLPPLNILRSEVVALLMDIPSKRLPLFKFRELFERRYHRSISVSDLYKMREAITILENSTGRMVYLNQDYRCTPSPTDSEGSQEVQQILEKPYCEHHFHISENQGWAEQDCVYPLPNVHISLKTLAPRVHTLLDSHQGSLPLNSFCACYKAEFGTLPIVENLEDKYKCQKEIQNQISDSASSNDGNVHCVDDSTSHLSKGVPLEHLISCIPGVQITKSVLAIKKVQWLENRPSESDVRSVSPALVGQLTLFSREMVDLLKSQPRCSILFNKFIPAYHHHFGRQCRVADYGFTKLMDLLEAIPHSVQILGQGQNRILTLTHRAQVKRFAADLLRILKSRASKQITLLEFSTIYEQCINKPFCVTDYGVCEITDLLAEISENTIVVASSFEDTIIGIPKREQTPEEIERTKQFAAEVMELFRHLPDCSMPFSKFIPAYHHHFSKQCRVADYGFTKLIELFEAIPNVLEVCGVGEDKVLSLTEQEKLKVLSDRLVAIVRMTPQQSISVDKLINLYARQHGHALRCQEFDAMDIPDLISKLRGSLKLQSGEKPAVVLVNQGFVHLVSLRIRRLLMEQLEGKMLIDKLCQLYQERFGQQIDLKGMLPDLEDVVKVEEDIIKLPLLLMLCRDILILLHENDGQLSLQNFDSLFLKRFGVPCRPAQYGFPSIATMLQSQPDYFFVRGRRSKRIVMINRETAGSPLPPMVGAKMSNESRKDLSEMDGKEHEKKDAVIINKIQSEELLQIRNSPVDILSQPIPSGVPSPEIQPEKQTFSDKDLMGFESPLPLEQDVITGMIEKERQELKTPPLYQTPTITHSSVTSLETDAVLRALMSNSRTPPSHNQTFSAPPSFTHFAVPLSHFQTFSTPSCLNSNYQTIFQSPPAMTYFVNNPSSLIQSAAFGSTACQLQSTPPTSVSSLPIFGHSPNLSFQEMSASPVSLGSSGNPVVSLLPNVSGYISMPNHLTSVQIESMQSKIPKSNETKILSSTPTNQFRPDSLSYEDLTSMGNRSLDSDNFPSTQSTPTRGSTRSRPRSRIAAQFSTPLESKD